MDDIVIIGSEHNGIRKLKWHLLSHFHTKDFGKLKYFLGIEIAQSKFGVVMSQRKYVLDILEEIGMLDYKYVNSPMDPKVKLVLGQGEPMRSREISVTCVKTKPPHHHSNISFLMNVVSQFLQSPCDSH